MAPPPKGSIPLPGIRWRGLNLQFFAFIFIPLTGILLFITFGSLSLHQDAMRTLVGERDERAARTAASALNEQLNHRASVVRGLAIRAEDPVDLEGILATSDFLQPDFDFGLAFFNPDGQLSAHTGENIIWLDLSIELGELLDAAQNLAGEQAVFSPVLKHPNQVDNLVLVAFTTSDNADIAVGAFSPISLARRTLAGAFSLGEKSSVFLISSDIQVIFQIGDFSSSESAAHHPGIEEALRGESGTIYLPVDGDEHVVAFSPVIPTGWALVIEEPWDSVANPLLNSTQLAPLVLVPVLLLALVALWFGARQIIQPLQALETRAADLSWGDYKSINESVGGIEEISLLQQTLIHLAEKIQRAQTGLHVYIGAITTGQEDERLRLARDLHDETIQALIALNQRVQLAQLKLSTDPEALVALDEIQTLIKTTIKDLRRVIGGLRPLYLDDLGLAAALQMLVQETNENHDIPIEFILVGSEIRFSPEAELAMYRIAQEGLNNVLRHAQASNASVRIVFMPEQIQLTIQDDGAGFAMPESAGEFAPNGHFGLLGIHERAELIGAKLKIHSELGQGASVIVALPIHKIQ